MARYLYILGRGWILNHMNLHQRQWNLKSACGKTRLNLEFKCGASPWEVPIFNNCNLYIYVNPLSTRAAEGLRSLNRALKVTPSGRYSLAIYNSSKPERQLSGFTTFAELSLALYVQKIHSVKLKGIYARK